jgi:uncharacterized membrane protein
MAERPFLPSGSLSYVCIFFYRIAPLRFATRYIKQKISSETITRKTRYFLVVCIDFPYYFFTLKVSKIKLLMKRFFSHFFRHFLSGLLVVLPFLATLAVIAWLLGILGQVLGPSSLLGSLWFGIFSILPIGWTGQVLLGYLLVIVLIGVVGYFAKGWVIRHMLAILREFFGRIPIVGKIFNSVEQVVGLWTDKKKSDMNSSAGSAKVGEVVLVNFANTKVFGILSTPEIYRIDGLDYHLVYVPSAPVPATGFTYFVKTSDVSKSSVGVEEMSKVLVSLGVLGPEVLPKEMGSEVIEGSG